ncbi:MAG: hypothetical protein KDD70_00270 [Bdellovibrionales bacterium]|nr:hypothetical protein [Bdellovibrionales bacterium]
MFTSKAPAIAGLLALTSCVAPKLQEEDGDVLRLPVTPTALQTFDDISKRQENLQLSLVTEVAPALITTPGEIVHALHGAALIPFSEINKVSAFTSRGELRLRMIPNDPEEEANSENPVEEANDSAAARTAGKLKGQFFDLNDNAFDVSGEYSIREVARDKDTTFQQLSLLAYIPHHLTVQLSANQQVDPPNSSTVFVDGQWSVGALLYLAGFRGNSVSADFRLRYSNDRGEYNFDGFNTDSIASGTTRELSEREQRELSRALSKIGTIRIAAHLAEEKSEWPKGELPSPEITALLKILATDNQFFERPCCTLRWQQEDENFRDVPVELQGILDGRVYCTTSFRPKGAPVGEANSDFVVLDTESGLFSISLAQFVKASEGDYKVRPAPTRSIKERCIFSGEPEDRTLLLRIFDLHLIDEETRSVERALGARVGRYPLVDDWQEHRDYITPRAIQISQVESLAIPLGTRTAARYAALACIEKDIAGFERADEYWSSIKETEPNYRLFYDRLFGGNIEALPLSGQDSLNRFALNVATLLAPREEWESAVLEANSPEFIESLEVVLHNLREKLMAPMAVGFSKPPLVSIIEERMKFVASLLPIEQNPFTRR